MARADLPPHPRFASSSSSQQVPSTKTHSAVRNCSRMAACSSSTAGRYTTAWPVRASVKRKPTLDSGDGSTSAAKAIGFASEGAEDLAQDVARVIGGPAEHERLSQAKGLPVDTAVRTERAQQRIPHVQGRVDPIGRIHAHVATLSQRQQAQRVIQLGIRQDDGLNGRVAYALARPQRWKRGDLSANIRRSIQQNHRS